MNGRPYKSITKNLFINFWQGAILGPPAATWALIFLCLASWVFDELGIFWECWASVVLGHLWVRMAPDVLGTSWSGWRPGILIRRLARWASDVHGRAWPPGELIRRMTS